MPLFQNPTRLLAGSMTGTGDNGVGEIQLTNATTVPSTNPSGGVILYASMGGLFTRDPNGTVSSLVSTLRTGATSWGAIAETINHNAATTLGFTPASGELQIMSVGVEAGQVISNVGFTTANTAASLPTHWWAVVLDKNLMQVAHSADQLTAALPSNTWQRLPMVTPYTTTYTGTYYLGLVFVATTPPTVPSSAMPAVFVTGANIPSPPIGGRSSTGLTVPGTDGVTTYAAPTGITGYYYAYAI